MHELDCKRMLCPMPVIKTQDKIAQLETGDQLRVICTDPGVMHDIPSWCRVNGHVVEQATEIEDEFIIVIKVVNDGT